LEYLNKIDINKNLEELIQKLKSIIEELLSIKEINSFSFGSISNIGNKINNLMEKNRQSELFFIIKSSKNFIGRKKIFSRK